ncbi:CAAX protease [Fadolivirus algeromassiliense]|jgi:hypothetical protein|uniref:CAAX protease n=1 Tax=Fadolivirus FV1/VV64 TaxID=3070911 RepID=A0A7D3UWC9_9VIRU|nr:CAAX protease [Fadolivirus algeromassiliense]QKF94754.1 CAAX protease [Fadolivirus FV1/VV64]
MVPTLILLFFQVFGIYFTVKTLNEQKVRQTISLKDMLQIIYAYVITMPLLEESLFRSVCKQYLQDIPYSNIVNGILFGLAHIQNYAVHGSGLITIFQVISTSYLGYYVVQYESFLYAYLLHVYYNLIVVLGSYGIYYYQHIDDKITNELPLISINDIRCPSRSVDDNARLSFNEYRYIPRDCIDNELLKSIKKFDEIDKKRSNIIFSEI